MRTYEDIRTFLVRRPCGLVEEHSAMRVASQSVKRFVDAAALPSAPVQARLCES